MIDIHHFTFGPFEENTYVVSNDDGKAWIIDPGMYYPQENTALFEYLQDNKLVPEKLLLTHAHLDHVFGVHFIHKSFGLTPLLHKDDNFIYQSAVATANHYGLSMKPLPKVELTLKEDTAMSLGEDSFELLLAPGHSPGSICFYHSKQDFVISGDVLFNNSIGRTDLPGGSHEQLLTSIRTKLMNLPNETKVYSGHGPMTTIGHERISNPFLQA